MHNHNKDGNETLIMMNNEVLKLINSNFEAGTIEQVTIKRISICQEQYKTKPIANTLIAMLQ